jgi:predicted nucleotidyltransferase
MDRDLKELLSALNAHSVKYVVVGGYAVGVHAQPRVTKDLDIFIEMSDTNASAMYAALAAFGAPLEEIVPEDFLKPTSILRIGVPPVAVDILQHIDGMTFAQAWISSAEYTVDDEVAARYISADDLIANKVASGRPQDLADVAAIRQAQAVKERSGKAQLS